MRQERWAAAAHARPWRLLGISLLALKAVGSPVVFTRPSEGASPVGVRRYFLPQRASVSQKTEQGLLLCLFKCVPPVPREHRPVLEPVPLRMTPALGFFPLSQSPVTPSLPRVSVPLATCL